MTDSFTLPYTRIQVRATLDRVEQDATAALRALEAAGYRLYRQSEARQLAAPWEQEGTITLALYPPSPEAPHG